MARALWCFVIAVVFVSVCSQSYAAAESGPVWLSWQPRVVEWEGMISPEDCDHIVSLGTAEVQRSTVMVGDDNAVNNIRTSSSTYLAGDLNDPVIEKLKRRLAEWTHLPVSHQESVQLVRYEEGQQYGHHLDYFGSSEGKEYTVERGGQRLVTVLMYLTDGFEGGETEFPESGLQLVPKKGKVVVFHNVNADGTVDPLTLHSALPVEGGIKWVATICIREAPHCWDCDAITPMGRAYRAAVDGGDGEDTDVVTTNVGKGERFEDSRNFAPAWLTTGEDDEFSTNCRVRGDQVFCDGEEASVEDWPSVVYAPGEAPEGVTQVGPVPTSNGETGSEL